MVHSSLSKFQLVCFVKVPFLSNVICALLVTSGYNQNDSSSPACLEQEVRCLCLARIVEEGPRPWQGGGPASAGSMGKTQGLEY